MDQFSGIVDADNSSETKHVQYNSNDCNTSKDGPSFHHESLDDWAAKWVNKKIGWHYDSLHPALEKHADKMIDGRDCVKILFPFCGKDIGMKWLADQGHEIVGMEYSEIAVKEFFTEHQLTYTTEHLPGIGGTLYKANATKIKLYCCDFYLFNVSVDAGFDAVWDRGSLSAVNRNDRTKYADHIFSLLTPSCRYLLHVLEYDETIYPGPPSNTPITDVLGLFEERFVVEKIDSYDGLTERRRLWGVDKIEEVVYLMRLKQSN